jgi:hypothetical protein
VHRRGPCPAPSSRSVARRQRPSQGPPKTLGVLPIKNDTIHAHDMVVVDVASRLVITDVASLLTLPWPINTPREPPGNPNVSPPYLNLPISFYLSQAIKTAVGSSPMSRRYRPPPGPCSSSGGASRRLDHSGGEEDRGELRVGLILPFPFSDVHRISVP